MYSHLLTGNDVRVVTNSSDISLCQQQISAQVVLWRDDEQQKETRRKRSHGTTEEDWATEEERRKRSKRNCSTDNKTMSLKVYSKQYTYFS